MTEVTQHAPVRVYVWFSRFTERNVIICWEYPLEGFPGGSDGKASACNAGDLCSVPELGQSLGEGNGNPLQYSCLENPMDRRVCQAKIQGVSIVRQDLATKPPPGD